MSHINDRERMRDELSGFAQMNNIANRINALEDHIERRKVMMSTPSNQESSFAKLNRHLQEEARARVSADNALERLYQPLYGVKDLHIGSPFQTSNGASEAAFRDAITFGIGTLGNIGINQDRAEQLASVTQIAVEQAPAIELDNDINGDDLQLVADVLEPQSEDNDEQVKFIVVPESRFVKLEDYNQLAQLVVQINSKLIELESEKFRLEARMSNMYFEITNRFTVQDNDMRMYVNSKTGDIQYLLESQMQEIRNQNLIRVEYDSTDQLTTKPVFIPEPSIKSKAKKGKATWDTTTTATMEWK